MANVFEMSKWLNEEDPDRVKYQSCIIVTPLQGKRFKVRLTRTKLLIKSGERSFYCEQRGIIFLYSLEKFEYELAFFKADFEQSKLQLKLVAGAPAKINNVFCTEAYLQRKDRIQIGFHFLDFSSIDENKKEHLLAVPLEERALKSDIAIYLEGETGTGKSSMARRIHEESGRSGRFVQLNLSAISPLLFESELFGHLKGSFTGASYDKRGAILEADQGTLFLDEINSLSLELQSKLLLLLDSGRFYPVGSSQEKKSQFRLVTSSNECLEGLVSEGRMRKDFYYRIVSGFTIKLPKINSNEFYFYRVLEQIENELDLFIPFSLKRFYLDINWDGNIRELKQFLMKKKVQQGRKLYFDSADELLINKAKTEKEQALLNFEEIKTLEQLKKDYIKLMYNKSGQNILMTSRLLKIAPGTVRSAIKNISET